jgi:hypothetical protein
MIVQKSDIEIKFTSASHFSTHMPYDHCLLKEKVYMMMVICLGYYAIHDNHCFYILNE